MFFNPQCEVHVHKMADGRCSCLHECSDCHKVYIGFNHTAQDCIKSLRKQLEDIRDDKV